MNLRARRGFILPLSIMLVLIASILLAAMLSRQSAQSLSAARQLGQYAAHHTERGLDDVIGAWVRNGSRRPLRERLTETGLAFEISLPNGVSGRSNAPEVMQVYFEDAQDTVLSDLSTLRGQAADDGARMLDALQQVAGGAAKDLTRTMGPVAVSAQSSSKTVLTAAFIAATGSTTTDFAVDTILKARSEGTLTSATIQEAARAGNFDTDQTNAIVRFIVAESSFWKLKVDILRNGVLVDGYDGYASVNARGQRERAGMQAGRGNVLQLQRRAITRSSID